MVCEETIMIGIDNSKWMKLHEASYELQLNCVRSYCVAKLKSNSKNAIGMLTLTKGSDILAREWLSPTSDIDRILSYLTKLRYSKLYGDLSFTKGIFIIQSQVPLLSLTNPRRLLMFARGPAELCKDTEIGEIYGNTLKSKGVAVDVVTFCLNEHNQSWGDWKKALAAFVDAANNGNNSHFVHIEPHTNTLVGDVLCKLIPRDLLDKDDFVKLKVPKRKRNQVASYDDVDAAAATCDKVKLLKRKFAII